MNSTQRERGTALVLAMLLVVTLVAATGTIATNLRRTDTRTVQELGEAAALAAADAGVDFARLRIARDPEWTGTAPDVALRIGDATVAVTIAALAPDRRTITATARWTNGAVRLKSAVVAEVVLRADALPTIVAWRPDSR